MERVEKGLYVRVHYTGTLDSGEEFDSSRDGSPLEVQVGAGQVIPGFDQALIGMALHETKRFRVLAEEAYGPQDPELRRSIPRPELPDKLEFVLGERHLFRSSAGQPIPAKVVALTDAEVSFDFNHPLAGEALTFDIEIMGISREPTQEHCDHSEGCGSGCCHG